MNLNMFLDSFFLVSFSTIFAIVNPLGALAPFLSMTSQDERPKKVRTAMRSCWISFWVLVSCLLAGAFIFKFFGLTIPALKVAGGCLLFLVAIDMLHARQSRSKSTAEEAQEGFEKEDIAIFPLAIPLLSGPGAIATTFILSDKAGDILGYLMIVLAIALTMLASYLILRQADYIARLLGRIGINVFSRLMGLILAAMAIQFILDGLKAALPGLTG